MSHHLVLGAGGAGRSTATHLVELGHTVTLASRSGVVHDRPWEALDPGSVTVVAADASDAEQLTELASGAESIINAINPPNYQSWDDVWPPVAAAVLAAAERSGAGLVIVGCLYALGVVDAPMREDSPLNPNGHKGRLRERMWVDALASHQAGRVRATELRASDYIGPGVTKGASVANDYIITPAARGRTVLLPMGRPDAPHTWTSVTDAGRLAATLATDERAWGRVWHVPSNTPRTMREVAQDAAALADRPDPRILTFPRAGLTAMATVAPFARELLETRHQFERPFIMDSTLTEATFGLTATPWTDVIEETVVHRAARATA